MLMIAFGPVALYAVLASVLGALGFASTRKPRLEGDAYFQEHLVKRLRQPTRYALTHPVETVKRWFR